MKSLPKFFLALGILMSAGGIAGAGILYRDVKIETLKHARTGDITLSLGDSAGWKSARGTLFRPGRHAVIMTLGGPKPGAVKTQSRYHGALDIEVSSPDGRVMLRQTVRPEGITLPLPDSGMSVALGAFAVDEPTEESWKVRARVSMPDSAFSAVDGEISILPPQIYEIGSYVADRIFVLIGLGIIALAGFGIIVVAASIQERSRTADASART